MSKKRSESCDKCNYFKKNIQSNDDDCVNCFHLKLYYHLQWDAKIDKDKSKMGYLINQVEDLTEQIRILKDTTFLSDSELRKEYDILKLENIKKDQKIESYKFAECSQYNERMRHYNESHYLNQKIKELENKLIPIT